MKKKLIRTFFLKIGYLDFILYENGMCRVDNSHQFETTHYTGKDRTKWWKWFKREAIKNDVDENVIDGAFGSWVRLAG